MCAPSRATCSRSRWRNSARPCATGSRPRRATLPMAGSRPYNGPMANAPYSCIAVDWGTTNRRAWALGPGGGIVAERSDSEGLLAVQDRRFAESLASFLGDWLANGSRAPVMIAGMAGSRLGWVEVPYVATPAALLELAAHLAKAGQIAMSDCWIVPGVSLDAIAQPEVMRG